MVWVISIRPAKTIYVRIGLTGAKGKIQADVFPQRQACFAEDGKILVTVLFMISLVLVAGCRKSVCAVMGNAHRVRETLYAS